MVLCTIALIFLLARGEDFRHALGFVVVLLVASIPIAIEIVRCARAAPAVHLLPSAVALAAACVWHGARLAHRRRSCSYEALAAPETQTRMPFKYWHAVLPSLQMWQG